MVTISSIKLRLPKSSDAVAQLPRGVVGSLSVEVFQSHGDVALRDVVSEHGGVGWAWGSGGLFQPECFFNPMT